VSFREDANRTRDTNAGANLGVVRRVAASPLKQDPGKGSITARRLGAALDETDLERVLESYADSRRMRCVSPGIDPDDLILTACADGTIHLWNAESRERVRQIPSWNTAGESNTGAISRRPRSLLGMSRSDTARLLNEAGELLRELPHDNTFRRRGDWRGHGHLWPLPKPVRGDRDRIQLWVQTSVGMKLDGYSSLRVLDGYSWLNLQHRLRELGGPP
jgi:hypothetical protein